jgi:hypothetical protein
LHSLPARCRIKSIKAKRPQTFGRVGRLLKEALIFLFDRRALLFVILQPARGYVNTKQPKTTFRRIYALFCHFMTMFSICKTELLCYDFFTCTNTLERGCLFFARTQKTHTSKRAMYRCFF